MKSGFIYTLTSNKNNVLCVGVTSNPEQRIWQHLTVEFSDSFTSKYSLAKLVYYEQFISIEDTIFREKQLNPVK